jgi:pimeloyl-ACP methyl ester carboxylesterase
VARRPREPLQPGWVLVDGAPVFHRWHIPPDAAGDLVHVHGFAISGTYLEPTAALLARRHRTYVPDLPGMGRSLRPLEPLDLPGLARALIGYLDAVGIERPTFVGNSLGCPIIIEVASSFPDRIDRAVLVSPAGGPNNRPIGRALRQMAMDGTREPPSMLPIATRDYLRFGVPRTLALFGAMTRYPTLERLPSLSMPTLVIAGSRDPLVNHDRVHVLSDLPHVQAVRIPGAHALNFSRAQPVADLIEAFLDDEPLAPVAARHGGEVMAID